MVHKFVIINRRCRLEEVWLILELNQKVLPPGYLLENMEGLAQYPGNKL